MAKSKSNRRPVPKRKRPQTKRSVRVIREFPGAPKPGVAVPGDPVQDAIQFPGPGGHIVLMPGDTIEQLPEAACRNGRISVRVHRSAQDRLAGLADATGMSKGQVIEFALGRLMPSDITGPRWFSRFLFWR